MSTRQVKICVLLLMATGIAVAGAKSSKLYPELAGKSFSYQQAKGLGVEEGITRRDPSDNRYYFVDPYGIYAMPPCYPAQMGSTATGTCGRYPNLWGMLKEAFESGREDLAVDLEQLPEQAQWNYAIEWPFTEAKNTLETEWMILAEKFPEKEVVVAREMTKVHEEFIRGKTVKVSKMKIISKGEVTLLLR